MEKQTKVVDQQSCQEVEGITHLVKTIEAKDAKIDSLLADKNEWENRALEAEAQLQLTAQELAATKVEFQQQQAATNEWENRAIKAEDALAKANYGKWWKLVLHWVGTMILTTIVGKAIENGSTQTINKIAPLFPVDTILSIPYEYAVQAWQLVTRIFVG
ncbi:phosphonate C-P lyase system protein PhnG [Shimazuella sp. AN120528]|uniref:phosphonate C-P lyase system protein PhnG n=1 Tax=Shimazuella soli TaxID=1892854 RepID=UPI001F10231C|nr:phosphonate C-P lyase system protein PhnG [Shimazuella soli]MCH5584071.1 phosphonate C-P lyase system protein PhnG [Shimazuella soli]